MLLPMFCLLITAVFITQLIFCFYARKLWIKLLPLFMPAGADILCWGMYFFGTFSHIHGGDFAAYIFGLIFLYMIAASGLAWGIYGIVKVVQKRRKTFVM